jgi:hypothetical protein
MTMPHPDLLAVLAGLLGVLIVASTVGYVLQRRLSPDGSNAVVENLNDRIRAWWIMIVLMGLALIGGKAGVTLLFGFCSFAALREFITLTDTRRADHWALAAGFFVVLPVQYYLVWIDWYGLYSIFIPVYAFLLMPIIASLRGDTRAFPRAHRRGAVGPDDLRLLHLACAGAAQPRHPRVPGAQRPADRLPGHRRADERCPAICLGQAPRPHQDRAQAVAVQDG